jgi:hypothetical protein
MRKVATILTAVALAAVCLPAFAADDKAATDDEGFIKRWLLLAPIPLAENQSGVEGLGKEQVKDEAKLKPKAGEKVKVGDKELEWKEYTAKDYFIDFNEFLGNQTEDSVGYAVCYVVSDAEHKDIQLRTGSDDQAKVYLNGKEVWKFEDARALDKDQNTTDVTLNKGVNVVVFKVVNEKIDWSGCVRFTDKDGAPLKGLKVTLKPE